VIKSAPDDPELVLELDIMQLGEPQNLSPPGRRERWPASNSSHKRAEGGGGGPGRTRTPRCLSYRYRLASDLCSAE
jgi:hypothetical protein